MDALNHKQYLLDKTSTSWDQIITEYRRCSVRDHKHDTKLQDSELYRRLKYLKL